MKYQADYLFDGYKIIENGFVELDGEKVINVGQAQSKSSDQLTGLIMPGFINTHCHLELSHLKNKVNTGTGLLPFLKSVVSLRDFDQNIIDKAIADQDEYMWSNGIQAVGDISNKADTAPVKSKSKIQYYTFVEMFDLLQAAFTDNSYVQYKEVYDLFDNLNGNRKAAVPHAPYTVTSDLFDRINKLNVDPVTVSIHNQETIHENDYFMSKKGGFSDFFKSLGINDSEFKPTGTRSLNYALQYMDATQKTLFVHNTTTNPEDIENAVNWNKSVYWATCPNANLYIENSLPDYSSFLEAGSKMTIGTDSLSSNWQLSILEEIKTIKKYNSWIPIETLLKWSTINGAEALSFEDALGSFEQGKSPGVILLENFEREDISDALVKRLV